MGAANQLNESVNVFGGKTEAIGADTGEIIRKLN
jgi:hypothetical protein